MSNKLPDLIAGSTRSVITLTWERDGAIMDLSGCTLAGRMRDLLSCESRAITGALSITDAANGIFSWDLSAADCIAGDYLVQFSASSGGEKDYTDPVYLHIGSAI